ncbi:hypothetical protein BT96DRAFT_913824 [Gymnopus androsaceus JB14]|uniref:Uncharacterized protein n=1 Tax=Gymnopus androsaceus JB14 TaxID=1447944 RepID=A0A6A4IDP2_9AGAR|nr:hypothetical protein BT96DRAFT_913824 [Gymnopus androsaceus JB14]
MPHENSFSDSDGCSLTPDQRKHFANFTSFAYISKPTCTRTVTWFFIAGRIGGGDYGTRV